MPYGILAPAACGCRAVAVRSFFVCAPLFAAFFILPLAKNTLAAVSGNFQELSQADKKDIQAAAQAISGSKWPGIVDCLLERPLGNDSKFGPGIHINYPSLGNVLVDADIRQWVTEIADAFEEHLDFSGLACALELGEPLPTLSPGQATLLPEGSIFELWGEYEISRPSPKAVSIAFELWNYTGSPEGNLDIITLNYSLLTGQRLTLVDIFEKPETALELMSAWSRKKLEPRLGAARRTAMLTDGTAPLMENFANITLTPEGICINFQPWQVAPRDAGIQRVLMPLEELLPSAPLLALWDK